QVFADGGLAGTHGADQVEVALAEHGWRSIRPGGAGRLTAPRDRQPRKSHGWHGIAWQTALVCCWQVFQKELRGRVMEACTPRTPFRPALAPRMAAKTQTAARRRPSGHIGQCVAVSPGRSRL